jgi:fermentation-respiration switch protein FrsA (DUF1100 family)
LLRVAPRLLLAYAAWVAAGWLLQRRVMFPRGYALARANPGAHIVGLERGTLDTDEGPVETWFVAGDGVSAERPGPLVVFAHGNAELIDDQEVIFEGYRRLGVSVLACEYRGYGRSAGSPSEAHLVEDHERALEAALRRPVVDPSRLIYHGRSVGAGVACALAVRRAPAALVLRAPFTSTAAMAGRFLVPSFAIRDRFDNAAVLRALDAPVLILHGRRDEVIPFEHGRRLHELARRSTFVEYDCGHNDFPEDSERHWRDVESFLREGGILDDAE